ncbi:MAG: hypothetical protein ACI840_002652, partial [Ulvibacter sp.]
KSWVVIYNNKSRMMGDYHSLSRKAGYGSGRGLG